MDSLKDKEQKQLDYLLADYGAVKSEIARRSNLQRVVLAAYISVVALILKEATEATLTSLFIMGLWLSAALSLNYYIREGLEICRLGEIAKNRISTVASKIIDVDPKVLLPSQASSQLAEIDNITKIYDRQFNWVLFLVVPAGVTLFYLSQDWGRLGNLILVRTRAPYIAIVTFIFVYWTTTLLVRHIKLRDKW